MAKAINQTYLFSKYEKYDEKLFKAMMNSDRVDKDSAAFEDLLSEISKRRTSDNMVKALKSPNFILLFNADPLDKSLKVFAAIDHKAGSAQKTKAFIDCSNIITLQNGKYVCSDINKLLAYLFDAMVMYTYYLLEERIVNNDSLSKLGSTIFAKLFSYIIDYIYKINSFGGARYQCMYLAALYYQVNILGKDLNSPSVQKIARNIGDISDAQANILMIDIDENAFINIKTFIEAVSSALHLPKLGLDAVVAKWMHIFGTGTVFSLELFPAFSAMICDACTDSYINNKNTIEKVVGANLMADYYKKLIDIEERV